MLSRRKSRGIEDSLKYEKAHEALKIEKANKKERIKLLTEDFIIKYGMNMNI